MHAENVVTLTQETFKILSEQTDLSPGNSVVNECLSRFVREVMAADDLVTHKDHVLSHETIRFIRPRLTNLLSRAEFEMEMYFSRRLAAKGRIRIPNLDEFWYRQNYRDLVRQEVNTLRSLYRPLYNSRKPMAFAGAGPLPLSAIDYYLQMGKPCVCIEINEEAAAAGTALIEALGLQDVIHYVHAPADEMDYSAFEIVFVAALVSGKQTVLDRIKSTAPEAIVGIRSADGLKTLLYDPVDVKEIETSGFVYNGCARATNVAISCVCHD